MVVGEEVVGEEVVWGGVGQEKVEEEVMLGEEKEGEEVMLGERKLVVGEEVEREEMVVRGPTRRTDESPRVQL